MITTRKAGTVKIIARSADGTLSGSADLNITEYDPSVCAAGEARYSNSIAIDAGMMALPGIGMVPENASCMNCHEAFSGTSPMPGSAIVPASMPMLLLYRISPAAQTHESYSVMSGRLSRSACRRRRAMILTVPALRVVIITPTVTGSSSMSTNVISDADQCTP